MVEPEGGTRFRMRSDRRGAALRSQRVVASPRNLISGGRAPLFELLPIRRLENLLPTQAHARVKGPTVENSSLLKLAADFRRNALQHASTIDYRRLTTLRRG